MARSAAARWLSSARRCSTATSIPFSQFAKKWIKGLWLGKMSYTDEHVLGAAQGRVVSRSLARRPESKRWPSDLLAKVVRAPMAPRASLELAPAEKDAHLTRAIFERIGPTLRLRGGWRQKRTPGPGAQRED